MTTISKFDELVGEALINAMRLHLDSMILCKNGSFSSAHQLAMEASQEIGKTLVLEHLLSQSVAQCGNVQEATIQRALIDTFSGQRSLKRQLSKTMCHLAKQPESGDLATLLGSATEQADDDDRAKVTYVSLTKKDRKIDLDGKKVIPRLIARKDRARRNITANNDFLTVYISGFVNGAYPVVSDTMAWEMSQENLQILQLEWPQASRKAQRILRGFERQVAADGAETHTVDDTVYATDDAVAFDERALATN